MADRPFTVPLASLPRRLTQLVFLAWRNLWRNRMRSGLTAGAMVAGVVFMIVMAALYIGMMRMMISTATDTTLGHLQLHREAFIKDRDLYAVLPWSLVDYLERTTPYAYAPRAYAGALAGAGAYSTGVMLEGIDPKREQAVTTLADHLRTGSFDLGRWPGTDTTADASPVYGVVVGGRLARALHLSVGSELVLITQAADGSIGNGLFRVAGVLKPVEPALDRMGVVMSLPAWQSLMALPEGVHELAVNVGDATQAPEAQQVIERALAAWKGSLPFPKEGGPVVVRRWDQINPLLSDMLKLSDSVVLIITVIVYSIVALGMLNTVLMAIHERRREFGLLLALGMGRVGLLIMVLLESFFLALLSAALGAALGSAWALRLETHGINYSRWLPEGFDWGGVTFSPVIKAYLTPETVITSVVIMLIITMIAALIPSWRTVRLKPAEVLHG